MNYFAGNITFKGNITLKFENRTFNFLKTLTVDNNSNVYFFGETTKNTSSELLGYFKEIISPEVISYDLSIDSEDKLEILEDEQVDGEYSCMAISGAQNTFEEVLEGFGEGEEVVCVREAEDSKAFGNKIIKVDIIS